MDIQTYIQVTPQDDLLVLQKETDHEQPVRGEPRRTIEGDDLRHHGRSHRATRWQLASFL